MANSDRMSNLYVDTIAAEEKTAARRSSLSEKEKAPMDIDSAIIEKYLQCGKDPGLFLSRAMEVTNYYFLQWQN